MHQCLSRQYNTQCTKTENRDREQRQGGSPVAYLESVAHATTPAQSVP